MICIDVRTEERRVLRRNGFEESSAMEGSGELIRGCFVSMPLHDFADLLRPPMTSKEFCRQEFSTNEQSKRVSRRLDGQERGQSKEKAPLHKKVSGKLSNPRESAGMSFQRLLEAPKSDAIK